jgi:hypothetical protein
MEVQNPTPPSPLGEATPLPVDSTPSVVPSRSEFATVFDRLMTRIDQGEALVARVERARGSFDATELIAVQAGIYRYSEAVELASKLVDRLGSAIKVTLQGQ